MKSNGILFLGSLRDFSVGVSNVSVNDVIPNAYLSNYNICYEHNGKFTAIAIKTTITTITNTTTTDTAATTTTTTTTTTIPTITTATTTTAAVATTSSSTIIATVYMYSFEMHSMQYIKC